MLLGAAAVMSNGTVVSRVGSAATAMAAHAWGRPVIICCETHKFAGEPACHMHWLPQHRKSAAELPDHPFAVNYRGVAGALARHNLLWVLHLCWKRTVQPCTPVTLRPQRQDSEGIRC